MLKQPHDSEHLNLLFEKNTIRKSSKKPAPTSLSLPTPIDGSTKSLFSQSAPPVQERPVVLPFKAPQTPVKTEKENIPSKSSHKIAQLKRLYALEQEAQTSAEAENSETVRNQASPSPVSHQDPPPEFVSKLKRTEARLNVAQNMLHLEESLEACLKKVSQYLCEAFSLWRVRIFVGNTGYPLVQDLRVQYLNGNRQLPDAEQSLKILLRTGKENHEQDSRFHRWTLPIKYQQKTLGAIELMYSPAVQITADEGVTLRSISDDLAEYLSAFIAESKSNALTENDPLTGFLNYSHFLSQIEQELQSNQKTKLSLLRIDPDFFGQINEVHSYRHGDQILQQIAVLINGLLPEESIKGRLHGASFAILLKNINEAETQKIAEQIRQSIACLKVAGKYNASLGVTASLGISLRPDNDQVTSNQLLIEAETALSQAQERGRNQIALYAKEELNSDRIKRAAAMARQKSGQVDESRGQAVAARKWSEILQEKLEHIRQEWQQQTEDYAVAEVRDAVLQMDERLERLLNCLNSLLDQKSTLDELKKMPLSYFIPSKIVAEIRRGNPKFQLISYEVSLMLLQESLLEVFAEDSIQPAIDAFFTCINDKLTQLKSELQKGG